VDLKIKNHFKEKEQHFSTHALASALLCELKPIHVTWYEKKKTSYIHFTDCSYL